MDSHEHDIDPIGSHENDQALVLISALSVIYNEEQRASMLDRMEPEVRTRFLEIERISSHHETDDPEVLASDVARFSEAKESTLAFLDDMHSEKIGRNRFNIRGGLAWMRSHLPFHH